MCNVFANEVLIPSKKFKEQIGESRHDISLVELQSIQCEFSISVDALMTKAAQTNIITKNRYISYFKKKNALPNFKEEVEKVYTQWNIPLGLTVWCIVLLQVKS